jgi:L-seryl-tRNA(Ser) seleniumtransferase
VARSIEELQARASALAAALDGISIATNATFGGGALPGIVVPSRGIALASRRPDALAAALRTGSPAVVGRIEGGRLILDLRTVEADREPDLEAAVVAARAAARESGG